MNYTVEKTTTENINFRILEKKLDDELNKIYGEVQDNYLPHNIVKDLKTIIIYKIENLIACGCLKFLDNDLAEVKRIFVSSENRGKSIAKIVVKEIEELAIETANIIFRHMNTQSIGTVCTLQTNDISAKEDINALKKSREFALELNRLNRD